MEKTTPNILIIGGGVAGMAAAKTFAHQDVGVHLVEKQDCLGGHAAMWSCMATDTCENCGACLSIEMADLVCKQKNVTVHLNSRVQNIQKKDTGYTVDLTDTTSIHVEKIIMATGFSPFNPDLINSFHHETYKNVITTARLNALLKEETISGYFNDKPEPKIAFIQCVGSRDREMGRDYCSQVCCKISMRQANKISYLFPDADITLFHMDLQVIGKEAHSLFNTLSDKISLVQGIPAEILEDNETKMLTIVAEDKEARARVARDFDLVVLSVGMQPCTDVEAIADFLDATPNSWGFFNTDQANISSKDISVAGCANGPKDILSSQQEGRKAATRVIEDLGLIPDRLLNIVVFGDGFQADKTARAVASKGYATTLFGPGTSLCSDTPVTVKKECRILSISGTAGNFSIDYESDKKKNHLACAAIIAAIEPEQLENPLKGLSNKALSLDEISVLMENTPADCPDTMAILLDYFGPEFKASAQRALETAIKAKALGKSVSIIMNKMLVHGAQGQRLYDQARKLGIDFFRFETPDDLQIQETDKKIDIILKEATLPGIKLEITCDCIVLPPTITPGQNISDAAALLNQRLDREGFLQSANIRHRLTRSPRKGIFFAGTGHDEVDPEELTLEITDILSSLSTDNAGQHKKDPGVQIDQKKCARCLTCLRICPHSAIVMNERSKPEIVPDACFSCHLCVSNCPAYAIDADQMANDQIAEPVEHGEIAILACERGAALAAGSLTLPAHINLIPIPCACRISSDVILRALLKGAAKVIVSGCHRENCRSLDGSAVAEASVEKVLRLPGIEPSTVTWQAIAANEPRKLERILSKA